MPLLSKKPLPLSKHISIIGCGWLGLPLAKHLVSKNFKVKGSTTHKDKIPSLNSNGIEGFYVELTKDSIEGDIENCLSESEILILNIPPGLRKSPEADFVKQILLLIPYIEKSSIKNVLFVSSTSVYADSESIPVITEDSIPNPDTESAKQLWNVEKLLQTNQNFRTTILRFGGLFGADRHPATFLSGKMGVKNPDAPVNLIHLDDCIGIIQNILESAIWNETLNAATTAHPSRKDYYSSICEIMDVPLPVFEETSSQKGKCIDSKKLVRLLDYEFRVKLNN
jgi:nucleoside-diphosphate-sugar epimerase